MTTTHFVNLCDLFKLGPPIGGKPERVYGGLLHAMWRIYTEKSTYAIKQLSPNIDLKNITIVKNYNLTEEIASRFSAEEIPSIYALSHNKNYLTIFEDTGFLIYPWVDAVPLHKDIVSEYHAVKLLKYLQRCMQLTFLFLKLLSQSLTFFRMLAL